MAQEIAAIGSRRQRRTGIIAFWKPGGAIIRFVMFTRLSPTRKKPQVDYSALSNDIGPPATSGSSRGFRGQVPRSASRHMPRGRSSRLGLTRGGDDEIAGD